MLKVLAWDKGRLALTSELRGENICGVRVPWHIQTMCLCRQNSPLLKCHLHVSASSYFLVTIRGGNDTNLPLGLLSLLALTN